MPSSYNLCSLFYINHGIVDISRVSENTERVKSVLLPPRGHVVKINSNLRLTFPDAPLDVEDFSCVSENWENLNCTWTEPWNPVRTEYDVHFKEPGRTSP